MEVRGGGVRRAVPDFEVTVDVMYNGGFDAQPSECVHLPPSCSHLVR